jgi:hypothetical protein
MQNVSKRVLVFAALTMGATFAVAQDLTPRIDHKPATRAARGEPVEIRARIVSVSGKAVYQPTVFLRVAGITGFSRVTMTPIPQMKDLFIAEIPASLAAGDFDYYIEAFDEDGNGPARAGTPEKPIHVAVGAGATQRPPPPPFEEATGGQGGNPKLLEGQKLQFAGGQDPRQMNTGMGKLITGGALGGVGTILLIIAIIEFAINTYDSNVNGVVAAFFGVPLFLVGVPIFIVGLFQRSAYLKAMKDAGFQVRFDARNRAPVVAFSMRF